MQREGRGSQLIALMLTFTGQTLLFSTDRSTHILTQAYTLSQSAQNSSNILYLVGICVSVAADSRQDAG